MPELAIMIIFIVAFLLYVFTKDSIDMPMSWDDDKEDYIRCANCEAYIRECGGYNGACDICPFYPGERKAQK